MSDQSHIPKIPTSAQHARPQKTSLVKIVGISFAIIGVCLVALFLVARTAAKKLTMHGEDHYMAKARQSEARTMLSVAYVEQKSFFAEHSFYSTDIKSLALTPWEGPLNYKIGFVTPSTHTPEQNRKAAAYLRAPLDPSKKDTDAIGIAYVPRVIAQSFNDAAKDCSDCTATNDNFKIVAVGNIDDEPKLDIWTIDDKKNLINVSDDTVE